VKPIELHVHSFSLRHRLRHRDVTGFDVFAYIAEMAALGFTGVNVSANGPGYRDLCGTDPAHFASVRAAVRDHGLRLELDTSDTRVGHMATMLDVAEACGADTLRTYTKYTLALEDTIDRTIADLRAIAPLAGERDVTVVLENHEDFTGPAIARILSAVDHPFVRALYDYGNSQMVGEDPIEALEAMAPHIARVHAKDHVVIHDHEGRWIQGVPMGTGRLPIIRQTQLLYQHGVRRFCFENVWAYLAPERAGATPPSTAWFAVDGSRIRLKGETLHRADALVEERRAFDTGWGWFRSALTDAGYSIEA
jgi:sugar phosphate isomerase/epimerase